MTNTLITITNMKELLLYDELIYDFVSRFDFHKAAEEAANLANAREEIIFLNLWTKGKKKTVLFVPDFYDIANKHIITCRVYMCIGKKLVRTYFANEEGL